MANIESILNKLPPGTQEMFRSIWESIPPSERSTFQLLLGSFPNDANLLRILVNLASVQVKLAFGQKHRVAILGPANVGKSTLYNQLVRTRNDRAQVSPLPGTTRINQLADAGLFTIVDTPGADAVGDVGENEQKLALTAAEEADFLIIIFDAIQGVKKTELELYSRLVALGKPYIVVLNKVDLVRRETKQLISHVAVSLNLKPEQVIPIVARSGENLSNVLMAVAVTEPELVAALGQALPQYRWQLAWRTIVGAASVSAVIALAPLPVVDFVPLVITQSVMVLGIARIYNYKITIQRARELVLTFGLGFLGRTLFEELSKFGGLPGWLLSAAIASSTTVVMGYAAVIWFERGEKLSSESLRKLTGEMTQYLLSSLKDIVKRKPDRKSLQQRISESLEKSPIAENREVLDNESHTEKPQSSIHEG
ncbi:MAG: 50S ribosome-binding GTPase [Anaerolineaceae bacterium]|nr:50S ribosome-binding GTPase [Anaerolineaceae bacterium]